jgi:hypothetical protein
MPFAMPLSGGSTPIARRLRSLFLAGAAMAIIPSLSHAQDTYLRGSVPEDVLSASSPDTLATRGLAAPGRSDSTATTSSDDGSDAFYAPTQDNAAAADNQQQAAPVAQTQDQQALQPDTMRVGAITSEADSDSGRVQRENTRQAPEQGRGPAQEADPFAPVGMRAGSFVLRPSLEQGIRATSNGDNSPSGSSSVLSETTLRLNAQSDWARHQATLDASGTLSKSISGQDVSEPQIDIQGNLRLDLTDQTTVNTGAGYRLRRESASNPNGVVGALKRPRSTQSMAALASSTIPGLFSVARPPASNTICMAMQNCRPAALSARRTVTTPMPALRCAAVSPCRKLSSPLPKSNLASAFSTSVWIATAMNAAVRNLRCAAA